MKKIISILTATRAEFGLLKPLVTRLNNVDEFDIRIVVTGAHLSPEFGLTYKEIEDMGFLIDEKIEILLSSDTSTSISKAMGLGMISFSEYFNRLKPDMLIVLGDRYETLAVVMAAANQRIPIAHLYGGETTEGAIDEAIRHAITKFSYLHFTSTQTYRDRVIQLGEEPNRVYNVGGLGIENILNEKLLTKEELSKSLSMSLDKDFGVVTFHPVTLEESSAEEQTLELLETLKKHTEMNFIVTKANADADGRVINSLIDKYASENNNIFAFTSLGMVRYLSALKYCKIVIGNSSSGILEAPSFNIPTINIGNRQKGRIQSKSIVNCVPKKIDINSKFNYVLSDEFACVLKNNVNPYGDGNTSEKITKVVKDFLLNDKIELMKKFYDL